MPRDESKTCDANAHDHDNFAWSVGHPHSRVAFGPVPAFGLCRCVEQQHRLANGWSDPVCHPYGVHPYPRIGTRMGRARAESAGPTARSAWRRRQLPSCQCRDVRIRIDCDYGTNHKSRTLGGAVTRSTSHLGQRTGHRSDATGRPGYTSHKAGVGLLALAGIEPEPCAVSVQSDSGTTAGWRQTLAYLATPRFASRPRLASGWMRGFGLHNPVDTSNDHIVLDRWFSTAAFAQRARASRNPARWRAIEPVVPPVISCRSGADHQPAMATGPALVRSYESVAIDAWFLPRQQAHCQPSPHWHKAKSSGKTD